MRPLRQKSRLISLQKREFGALANVGSMYRALHLTDPDVQKAIEAAESAWQLFASPLARNYPELPLPGDKCLRADGRTWRAPSASAARQQSASREDQ